MEIKLRECVGSRYNWWVIIDESKNKHNDKFNRSKKKTLFGPTGFTG